MPVIKLIKTEIDKAITQNSPLTKRLWLWDSEVKGFGLSVTPSGVATFVYQYRDGKGRAGRTQKVTIGHYPSMTPAQAREIAKRQAGTVAHGGDPAALIREDKAKLTINDVGARFLKEHVAVKLKAKTAYDYEKLMAVICAELGTRKLADLTGRAVSQFHLRMKDTPYQANRALAVLSSLYSWAGRNGFCPADCNPCRYVDHFKEKKRTEFLPSDALRLLIETIDKMQVLGEQCRQAKTRLRSDSGVKVRTLSPFTATALKVLLLTGARRNEILSLQWSFIDEERRVAYLPDSKTGAKVLQLPEEVLTLLQRLPRLSNYVFPSPSDKVGLPYMTEIHHAWKAVLQNAGLAHTWRIHDLRHAFASEAIASGDTLPMVGEALGHKDARTTQRYAHVALSAAQRVADGVAKSILSGREKREEKG